MVAAQKGGDVIITQPGLLVILAHTAEPVIAVAATAPWQVGSS